MTYERGAGDAPPDPRRPPLNTIAHTNAERLLHLDE